MEPWLPGHYNRDVHGLTLVVKASCGVCTGRSQVVELWPAFGGNEVTSKELARNEVPTKAQGRASCTTPPGFALAPLGADDAHRKWGFDSSVPEGQTFITFFFLELPATFSEVSCSSLSNLEATRNSGIVLSLDLAALYQRVTDSCTLCVSVHWFWSESVSLLHHAAQYFSVIDPRGGGYVES